jgi:hypothetical protein
MEALIPQIIAAISPTALPIVVCVCVCAFIYFKIGRDRKQTKVERDEAHDDLVTRVTLLEREIEEIKQLDLATKLAQIQTDLNWIKEKLK